MNNSQLTAAERKKYTKVWGFAEYRHESPAFRVKDQIVQALSLDVHPVNWKTAEDNNRKPCYVIDFGCGAGMMAKYLILLGFHVVGVDIAPNCMERGYLAEHSRFCFLPCAIHEFPESAAQAPAIGGYCVDVMEHIPEQLVDATLNRMSDVCRRVYFRIALFPDHWGETIGVGTLHPTVKAWQWWVAVIADYFSIERSWCEDDTHHGGRVLVVIAEVKQGLREAIPQGGRIIAGSAAK